MASHERFCELLAAMASEHMLLWKQCESLARDNEKARAQLVQKEEKEEEDEEEEQEEEEEAKRKHADFRFPPEAIVQAPARTPREQVSSVRLKTPRSGHLGIRPDYVVEGPPHSNGSVNPSSLISGASATLLSVPSSLHVAALPILSESFVEKVALTPVATTPRPNPDSMIPSPKKYLEARPEQEQRHQEQSISFGHTASNASVYNELSMGSKQSIRTSVRELEAQISQSGEPGSPSSPRTTRTARTTVKGADLESLCRIMGRLGVLEWQAIVTAQDVFSAILSLGLSRYSIADIELLMRRIRDLRADDLPESPASSSPASKPALLARAKTGGLVRGSSHDGKTWSFSHSQDKGVPFRVLAEFLTSDRERRRLGNELAAQLFAIKEVLVSGEANRLVAHLTNVHVDDLAAQPPRAEWYNVLEPIIGTLIVLNGVVLGIQTDPALENWNGWIFIDSAFMLVFLMEIIFRMYMVGLKQHVFGEDKAWSFFDACIVLAAIVDIAMQIGYPTQSGSPITIVRTFRLLRLSRLIRIFRLGILRELRIMVRGLFSGFRTLFWAMVLLLVIIYVLALFGTVTLRTQTEDDIVVSEKLFSSVQNAMLTCFRCFVGDCTTSRGEPIVKLLSDTYGARFVVVYLVSFTFVTFGLFNLIMAIYVEITMAAAKRTDDKDRERAMRESLRVAQLTKKLLKKFCSAQSLVQDPSNMHASQVSTYLRDSDDFDFEEDMSISKHLFLLIIQDPEVQHLMDQLEIPPERAELFDTLDADGSGGLQTTELVYGLLKVRGDARRSDVIAALLAVRSAQDRMRSVLSNQEKMMSNQERMMLHMGIMDHNWESDSVGSRP